MDIIFVVGTSRRREHGDERGGSDEEGRGGHAEPGLSGKVEALGSSGDNTILV